MRQTTNQKRYTAYKHLISPRLTAFRRTTLSHTGIAYVLFIFIFIFSLFSCSFYQNVTLALVSDASTVPYGTLPPPVSERSLWTHHNIYLLFLTRLFTLDIYLIPDERDESGTKGFYKPIIFPNEFWHLREHYVELNSTTPSLPLQIVFQPMSYLKFQMFAAITNGFKEAAKQQGAGAGAELDEIKRMLLETNPWFLGLTGLVSILHVV